MSGKPSTAGVEAVIGLLDRIAALESEIIDLQPKANRLRSAECEVSNLRTALATALRGMDLESTGNAGYENRLAWFLREMRRQAKATP